MTFGLKHLLTLMLGALLFVGACSAGQELPDETATIFLVRHAEKETDGDNPGLTAEGFVRAEELARLLQRERVEAIWSTDYARTLQTAQPLSQLIDVPVQIYDPSDLEAFASTLKANDETALIVGHSNTTPQLAEALGGDGGEPIVEATEYDRLYVLTGIGTDEIETEIRRFGVLHD